MIFWLLFHQAKSINRIQIKSGKKNENENVKENENHPVSAQPRHPSYPYGQEGKSVELLPIEQNESVRD